MGGGGVPILPNPGQPGPMQPGEFAGGSVANVTTFQFTEVDPPSPLYVQRDDILVLTMVSSVAPETVTFVVRFLRVPEMQGGQPSDVGPGKSTGSVFARGIIQPMTFRVSQAAPLTVSLLSVSMAEGYILSVSATSANALSRGQTIAKAFLTRGAANIQSGAFLLFSDYVAGGQQTGWPGGRQLNSIEGPGFTHSIQQGSPAAGADWNFGASPLRRAVKSFAATFITGAAVANRNIEIIVDDGVNVVWRTSVPVAVPASSTVTVSACQSNAPTGVVPGDLTVLIPPGLVLPPLWRLRSNTQNIQALDQWSNIWLNVEEWVDQN